MIGAVAMWLMLPRAGAGVRARAGGVVLGLVSLGLFASQWSRLGDWVAASCFLLLLAGITVVAAAATVTSRKPVYSAIWFGLTLLGTAGLVSRPRRPISCRGHGGRLRRRDPGHLPLCAAVGPVRGTNVLRSGEHRGPGLGRHRRP